MSRPANERQKLEAMKMKMSGLNDSPGTNSDESIEMQNQYASNIAARMDLRNSPEFQDRLAKRRVEEEKLRKARLAFLENQKKMKEEREIRLRNWANASADRALQRRLNTVTVPKDAPSAPAVPVEAREPAQDAPAAPTEAKESAPAAPTVDWGSFDTSDKGGNLSYPSSTVESAKPIEWDKIDTSNTGGTISYPSANIESGTAPEWDKFKREDVAPAAVPYPAAPTATAPASVKAVPKPAQSWFIAILIIISIIAIMALVTFATAGIGTVAYLIWRYFRYHKHTHTAYIGGSRVDFKYKTSTEKAAVMELVTEMERISFKCPVRTVVVSYDNKRNDYNKNEILLVPFLAGDVMLYSLIYTASLATIKLDEVKKAKVSAFASRFGEAKTTPDEFVASANTILAMHKDYEDINSLVSSDMERKIVADIKSVQTFIEKTGVGFTS